MQNDSQSVILKNHSNGKRQQVRLILRGEKRPALGRINPFKAKLPKTKRLNQKILLHEEQDS